MQKRGSVVTRAMLVFLSAFLILFLAFSVIAAHTVTKTDRVVAGNFSFNEDDPSAVINITINITHAEADGMDANVTNVNITIPSTFRFVKNETINSTVSLVSSGYARNTSTVLTFNNDTYLINASVTGSLTNRTFWFNISASTPGIYNITIETLNRTKIYNSNLSVQINDTTPPDVYATNLTIPNFLNYSGLLVLNISVSDVVGVSSVRFNITNGSGAVRVVNTTNPTGPYWNGTINTASFADGVYNISVIVNDTATYGAVNSNRSANLTVIFDNTAPTGGVTCTPSTVNTGDTVTCSCTGSDATSGVNSTSVEANPSTTSTGTFTVQCTVKDRAGNTGSPSAQYTVEQGGNVGGGGGSGGGSGGSSTTTWTRTEDKSLTNLEVSDGSGVAPSVSATLGARERAKIMVRSTEHHVGVVSLTATSAVIEVASTPQRATFTAGETKEFDVSDDGTTDIAVTLVSVTNGKAALTIAAVKQPAATTSGTTDGTQTGTSGSAEGAGSNSMWWIIGIIVLVIVIVVVFLVVRKNR